MVELEVSSGRSGVSQTLFSLNFSTQKVLALELRFESGTFPKMFFSTRTGLSAVLVALASSKATQRRVPILCTVVLLQTCAINRGIKRDLPLLYEDFPISMADSRASNFPELWPATRHQTHSKFSYFPKP